MAQAQTLYSSKLSSKTSLIAETEQILQALAAGNSVEQVRELVMSDNLLMKATRSTRSEIWKVVAARYFNGREEPTISQLALLASSALPERDRHLILFYELAKATPLVYDLTVDCLYGLYEDGRSSVTRADILGWLSLKSEKGHPEIAAWSPQTVSKVASNYLTIVRDLGLLEGKQLKRFAQLYVPLSTFVYVLYHLKSEGHGTKAILSSPDFRLFLMDERDILLLLEEATRAGYITFQQAGDIQSLAFRYEDSAEVVDELIGQV